MEISRSQSSNVFLSGTSTLPLERSLFLSSCVPHALLLEAFLAARVKVEFRSRQRFKLRLRAKASNTIRKYGFYEKDEWTPEESALAERLLADVARETWRQRRATGTQGQPDAWVWQDHAAAPLEELLGRAVARVKYESRLGSEGFPLGE